MKNLILYGDSLLARMNKSLVLQLEVALENNYIVHNYATGGFTTTDSLVHIEPIIKIEPDKIVISLGTNDIKPWAKVPLKTYQENIADMVNKIGTEKVVWFLPPPIDENKLQGRHTSLRNEDLFEYRNAAKDTLITSNVRYIDSDLVFSKLIADNIDYHDEDGVHLNEVAYNLIFDEIKRLI